MKTVSFRVRKFFDSEVFLTFDISDEANLDEDILDFLEDEEPEGIVPIIYEEEEECDTFSYEVTDKIRLSELSNQEINAEMVLLVLRGLILAFIDMQEYRIPLSYLVLNQNYVYIDSDYKIEFICIPLEEMQGNADLPGFLRNLIAGLRYDPTENISYVARLLTYVNDVANFNLRNMEALIEELMEQMEVNVQDDASAEIYAEYQELEEEPEETMPEPVEVKQAVTAQVEPKQTVDTQKVTKQAEPEQVTKNSEPSVEDIMEKMKAVESMVKDIRRSVKDIELPAGEVNQSMKTVESMMGDLVAPVQQTKAAPVKENKEMVFEEAPSEELEDEDIELRKGKLSLSKEHLVEPELMEENVVMESEEEDSETLENEVAFKTREAVTGVVLTDELDEFLAEKEREEKLEESNIKIKKNIKINRASIVKSTQEELKEAEENNEVEEPETEEETVSNSILGQTLAMTGILGAATPPKINPYLIRVNTEERVMIDKQNFKIGKANMGVDYRVRGNGAVSRIHATIINRDGVYYIKDNKSTNHTYVNGKNVQDGETELLTHDCRIVLGDEEFTFKLR